MTDQRGPEPDAASIAAGHEESDVSIRPLAIFLTSLAVSLVAVGGAMAVLFWAYMSAAKRGDPPPSPLAAAERAAAEHVPGPLLEVASGIQLEQLRSREARRLAATEWVDEPQGVARIPIDEAIALAAENGLPQWPAVTENPQQAPAEEPQP